MIAEIAPVIRTIEVGISPERAFELFTERIGEWWPLQTHGIFGEDAKDVVCEGHVGGRVYEVSKHGEEELWAEVLEYEPPRKLTLSWRPNPERPAPTHIEVTFSAEGSGTKVELIHTGWERLGDHSVATEARDFYDSGWPLVLRCFAEVAGST